MRVCFGTFTPRLGRMGVVLLPSAILATFTLFLSGCQQQRAAMTMARA